MDEAEKKETGRGREISDFFTQGQKAQGRVIKCASRWWRSHQNHLNTIKVFCES